MDKTRVTTPNGTLLRRADALLDRLLDMDGEARERVLQAECADAPELLALVRRLLRSAEEGRASVPTGAATRLLTSEAPTLAPGSRFGAFEVQALLGRGGMGEVYRARRADGQFEQLVAIKRIAAVDAAGDSQRVLGLHRERALLAKLRHPGIAVLLDGGLDAQGHPWFAMEYIEGLPLRDYLRAKQPSLPARLALLKQLIEAVAHAHRALVVHGDLKPANLLIEADGRLRVLDFGIARSLSDEAADSSIGWFSPDWASPEQGRGEAPDTRSDQYQIGLLARYLLGNDFTPFEQPRLELSDCARAQGLTHAQVLRGDLSRVIERCLASAPQDRYPDLGALLRDIEAASAGRPISLRQAEPLYVLRRFLHRHWLSASLGGAAVLGLLGGMAGTAWQAANARAERDLARLEAQRQDALREHLMLIFREGAVQGSDLSPRALLDASAAQLDAAYGDDPPLQRSVLLVLGELYFNLGDMPAARALLERYLQQADGQIPVLDHALAAQQLAAILLRQGEIDAAEAPLQQAESLLTRLPPRPSRVQGLTLSVRSQWLRQRGQIDEGLEKQRASVAVMEAAPDAGALELGVAQSNLGMAYVQRLELDLAHTYLQRALDTWADAGLAHNTHALTTAGNLGMVALLEGRYADARLLLEHARSAHESGRPESPSYASVLSNLARTLLALDRADEAAPLTERAAAIVERLSGPESLDLAGVLLARADVTLALGEADTAQQFAERAQALFRARTGPNHPLLIRAELSLALIEARRATPTAAQRLDGLAERLEQAPPLLRRQAIGARIAAAEAWLRVDARGAAVASAEAALALAQQLPTPLSEQAEARFWRAFAMGDLEQAGAELQSLAEALGDSHSRVRALQGQLGALSRRHTSGRAPDRIPPAI